MNAGDICPRCQIGQLVVKHSAKGNDFLGCTNYRSSGCKFTAKVEQPEPEPMVAADGTTLDDVLDILATIENKIDLLIQQRYKSGGTA